jgi:hypothetical protein
MAFSISFLVLKESGIPTIASLMITAIVGATETVDVDIFALSLL